MIKEAITLHDKTFVEMDLEKLLKNKYRVRDSLYQNNISGEAKMVKEAFKEIFKNVTTDYSNWHEARNWKYLVASRPEMVLRNRTQQLCRGTVSE